MTDRAQQLLREALTMSRRFRPETEASAELEHAALWYEDERDAVDATLGRIADWPEAAPRIRAFSMMSPRGERR